MRTTFGGQTVWSSFEQMVASFLASAGIETKKRLRRTALGYCRECRMKVEILNSGRITFKRSRPAAKDLCPKCGTKVFLISEN